MKRPFLHIFIFYMVGIIFLNKFKVDIRMIKLALLLNIFFIVVLILIKRKTRFKKYILLMSIFLIGIIATENSIQNNNLPKFYNENVKAIGTVKEVLSKEENQQKCILYVERIDYRGRTYNIDEKLILSIYGEIHINTGDRILGEISIKEPNRNTNPKLFNYKLYLQSKNIFASASSKDYNVEILSRDNLSKFEKVSKNIERKIILALDRSLNIENSSILKSIILGDDSFLKEDYVKNFRKLGLSHILAVSGLHIAIIFGFIVYILDLLKVHRKISMVVSITIVWIYASLIGFPPSVLRASLMFTFLIIGKLTYNRCDTLNTLSLAGFFMLLYRPNWIFSMGFQLSFIATFTILLFMPKVKRLVKIRNKKLKTALALILTAQIGITPISLYYFNELQILSIISNLIISPILTISIIIGFLIILSSIISIKISVAIGILGDIVLNLLHFISTALFKMTYLNIWTKSPSLIEIIFYYFFIFIVLKIIDIEKVDKKIQKSLYLNFFIVLIISSILQLNSNTVSVEFIDVGQGDSCLVRLKDKNILIDTGGNAFGDFDIGENILLPYLRKTGVKTIDGVFLSHFDADHSKGLLSLFGEIDLKNIFIGYKSPENPLYNEILKKSKIYDVKVKWINKGDVLKLDLNNYIEVLQPSKTIEKYSGENDNSLVFLLSSYNRKILFTGDIEEKGEDYIIRNTKKTNIDILKVPHHGSKTSSKDEFLKHFNPKWSVIQVGKNNFGHPNKDILKRYYENNIKVFRNDKLGLIKVEITKDNIDIQGYIKKRKTFLNYLVDRIYILIYALYSGAIILLMIEYRKTKDNKLEC